ncbi:MAG: acyl-CoA thioesterase II [Planctomycetota bacterium]
MSDVLQQLLDQLRLERLEDRLFRGQSQDLGWGTVFGGQVLGQAVSAAGQTVPEERQVHSLHGYFLRKGDTALPIIYDVERIRDGSSFTTRRVIAIQKGRPIFSLSASFQVPEEGLDHQAALPATTPPEELLSERELAQKIAQRIPEGLRASVLAEKPIEIRPVDPTNPLKPSVGEPRRQVWFRANGQLPDDPRVHRHLLAYASDFHLLGPTLQPHGVSWFTPGMQIASLDHAMWFHRPFRLDEWLLYDIDSPSACGARGLARGQFFTREGVLVASTAQEGLIRRRTAQDGLEGSRAAGEAEPS